MKRRCTIWLFCLLLAVEGLYAGVFDPLRPDYDQLNKLVIQYLNQKRAQKGKATLVANASLQKAAVSYTDKFVLRKFENSDENRMRISKKVKKACLANGFHSKLIDFSINTASAVNFYGRAYYLDREDSTSDLHLYVGNKKPSRKEKEQDNFKSIPIKQFTYEELAEVIAKKFMHDKGHFKTLNNAYDQIGISCVVEPRSLGGHKLPQIKAIIVVGGKLINW